MIRFVLVNGQVALDEGEMTGARGGRTLRRKADGTVGALGQHVAPRVELKGRLTNGHGK